MKKKIAFQGRRGAYSESAARYLFGEDIDVLPMNTFEEIYQAIETAKPTAVQSPLKILPQDPFTKIMICSPNGVTRLWAKSNCKSNIAFALIRERLSKV